MCENLKQFVIEIKRDFLTNLSNIMFDDEITFRIGYSEIQFYAALLSRESLDFQPAGAAPAVENVKTTEINHGADAKLHELICPICFLYDIYLRTYVHLSHACVRSLARFRAAYSPYELEQSVYNYPRDHFAEDLASKKQAARQQTTDVLCIYVNLSLSRRCYRYRER